METPFISKGAPPYYVLLESHQYLLVGGKIQSCLETTGHQKADTLKPSTVGSYYFSTRELAEEALAKYQAAQAADPVNSMEEQWVTNL